MRLVLCKIVFFFKFVSEMQFREGVSGYTLAPLFFSMSYWPGLKFIMHRRRTGDGV